VFFALAGIAQHICDHLDRAGHTAVKVEPHRGGIEGLPQPQARQIRESVQSLRLDAVVACAYQLSREDAASAVRSGLVKLDFVEQTKPDCPIAVGALLSMRGFGRARLVSIEGRTRRSGRIVVLIDRYG
jgi:RNA-binding protein YlmH